MPEPKPRCVRCDYKPASSKGRCDACHRYWRRTGEERPYRLILATIDRQVEREAVARRLRAATRR